ncbi:DapH/DapD/GlmU-related protein [Vibrio splendidus]
MFINNINRMVDSFMLIELGIDCSHDINFDSIGDIKSNSGISTLSYISDEKYLDVINENSSISGALCTKNLAPLLSKKITPIICSDPTFYFFSLVDRFAKKDKFTSKINSNYISEFSSISSYNVFVGNDVTIEENVTIKPGVYISDGTVVRSGAVLGLDTFQHQRTKFGVISPSHDGFLIIGNNVEIGSNCTISKGFSYRNTIIESGVKIDAQTYIGHGARIGEDTFLCAGSRIMGHVTIGKGVFVGPSSTISSRVKIGDGARVSIGSIVNKDVPNSEVVTGNFAIPHGIFIERMKNYPK